MGELEAVVPAARAELLQAIPHNHRSRSPLARVVRAVFQAQLELQEPQLDITTFQQHLAGAAQRTGPLEASLAVTAIN